MQTAEGWKIILLLRLSPIVPWNLLNIAMASTNVPFWQFTIASAIGERACIVNQFLSCICPAASDACAAGMCEAPDVALQLGQLKTCCCGRNTVRIMSSNIPVFNKEFKYPLNLIRDLIIIP